MNNIRNFAIISHVDHGKSTLADRFLEMTETVDLKKMHAQFLDSMDLEREKGITIKLKPVRMMYKMGGEKYILNLIDTPGHVDFSYEVERSLAACEGVILLVDSTKGIQAQTLSNFNKAKKQGLVIIPAVNKIDSPLAKIEDTAKEISSVFGFRSGDILRISGKTGENVEKLLDALVRRVPLPSQNVNKPFRALIFDSFYDPHLGVVAVVRVFDGSLSLPSEVRLFHSRALFRPLDMGFFGPEMSHLEALSAGDVGYIATGLKDISLVRVGDTVLSGKGGGVVVPLRGYREPKPVVYLSIFPENSRDYGSLRKALEKLKLNDASLEYSPENAGSLGIGFRCGVLGLLHSEITQERLLREFGVSVFATAPSVSYKIVLLEGTEMFVSSAGDFPEAQYTREVYEPFAKVSIFTPPAFIGAVMDLCDKKRGVFAGMDSLKLVYEMPLFELISGFYDSLKSISSGYASIDYEVLGYERADVVCMDVLLAGEKIAPLSHLVRREDAGFMGRNLVRRLKELLPKEQFPVSIQAAVGGKIIARETLSAAGKNVLEGIYGGHRERKDKLLERQRRGKRRLKQFGKVHLSREVLWTLLRS